MKKRTLLFAVVASLLAGPAFGWGKIGHDAIAYIAECNLTPRAKKNIEKCLGHSIVYDASWMDCYRHTPAYKHTSRWHTANVDADGQYAPREGGDAVFGIEQAMALLSDYRRLDDSTVVANVRCLVHLVGDMHCPGHVKYPGVRNFEFSLDGKRYEFHSFWDTYAIELNHRWHYMEWQHQLDRCSRSERRRLAAGTPREWMAENARACRIVHTWTLPGQQFGRNEARDLLNRVHPLAERQILKAGYRLARVLNELFG